MPLQNHVQSPIGKRTANKHCNPVRFASSNQLIAIESPHYQDTESLQSETGQTPVVSTSLTVDIFWMKHMNRDYASENQTDEPNQPDCRFVQFHRMPIELFLRRPIVVEPTTT